MQFLETNWVTFYNFRIKEFDDSLNEDHLDVLQIRKLCFAGKMLNKFSVYGLWHAFFHLLKKVNTNSMPHSLDTGIPEGQGRRAMAWRILLNYLPESRASWTNYLKKQRDLYHQFLGKSSKWSNGSNRLLCFDCSFQYPKNDIW